MRSVPASSAVSHCSLYATDFDLRKILSQATARSSRAEIERADVSDLTRGFLARARGRRRSDLGRDRRSSRNPRAADRRAHVLRDSRASCLYGGLNYLRFRNMMRLKAFADQFEMALRAISGALRVGIGLRQALVIVVDELPDPARREFRRVIGRTNFGIALVDAIEEMAKSIPGNEMQMFTRVIRVQQQTGGDLASVLENLAIDDSRPAPHRAQDERPNGAGPLRRHDHRRSARLRRRLRHHDAARDEQRAAAHAGRLGHHRRCIVCCSRSRPSSSSSKSCSWTCRGAMLVGQHTPNSSRSASASRFSWPPSSIRSSPSRAISRSVSRRPRRSRGMARPRVPTPSARSSATAARQSAGSQLDEAGLYSRNALEARRAGDRGRARRRRRHDRVRLLRTVRSDLVYFGRTRSRRSSAICRSRACSRRARSARTRSSGRCRTFSICSPRPFPRVSRSTRRSSTRKISPAVRSAKRSPRPSRRFGSAARARIRSSQWPTACGRSS